MFNSEKFKTEIYQPLFSKTEKSSGQMANYHKGLRLSATELADGYANGMTAEEIKADLNNRRIQCQMDFYPFSETMREKTQAFLDDAFKLDPKAAEDVSRLLSMVNPSANELRTLARDNKENYTALRAIASYAESHMPAFGANMSASLESYRTEVEKQALGLVDTCCKGVLEKSYHTDWSIAAQSRMEKLEGAHSKLMVSVGAEKPAPDGMQQAFNELPWRS